MVSLAIHIAAFLFLAWIAWELLTIAWAVVAVAVRAMRLAIAYPARAIEITMGLSWILFIFGGLFWLATSAYFR